MRVLGPGWHCVGNCFDTYNKDLPSTADKRGVHRNTIRRRGSEIPSCEVGEKLFTVTSLSSVVHIHTLSCA